MSDQQNENELLVSRILKSVGPLKTPPQDVADEVKAAVHAAWLVEVQQAAGNKAPMTHDHSKERVAPRGFWQQYRMAAAVSAVALGLFVGMWQLRSPEVVMATLDSTIEQVEVSDDATNWRPPGKQELRADQMLRTGAGAFASLSFDNGINLRLGESSTVRFVGRDEIVLSKGEVYIDSHRYTDNFKVVTEFGEAVDVGTQFLVGVDDDRWAVQVREGKVNVSDDDIDFAVEPGSRIEVARDNTVKMKQVSATDMSWRWSERVRPDYVITGKSLHQYLGWVAGETGKRLQYASVVAEQQARQVRLGGPIDGYTAIESLPVVLKGTNHRLLESSEQVIMVEYSNQL
jgi:ferric-dicitrate binding protein FerR (iron transport regulator)